MVDGTGRPLAAGLDLAPRDIMARTVLERRRAGVAVGLDLRPALAARGEAGFPSAVAACRVAGFDPLVAPVPVVPAAHFHMGGVLTDAHGRTSIRGLRACGEVATTGLHGANRLASNALLEALVMGERVARDAGVSGAAQGPCAVPGVDVDEPALAVGVRGEVRRLASEAPGVFREGWALAHAEQVLAVHAERLDVETAAVDELPAGQIATSRACPEARNLTLTTRLIALAARSRTESRGAHLRSDSPSLYPAWQRRQTITAADLRSRANGEPQAAETCTHDAA